MPDKVHLTDAEWRERLTPEQYQILREAGTERAFTGKYDKNKAAGEYLCAGCGAPLFSCDTKYDSGSGWPSFTAPAEDEAVEEHRDATHGMVRTEVRVRAAAKAISATSFPTARATSGLRYCINSAALDFKPEDN